LTPEKAKYVTANRLKLELGISEEFMKNLKRAQELLCQKGKSHKNFEATLAWALEELIRREDPLRKAERALAVRALAVRALAPKASSNKLAINFGTKSVATLESKSEPKNNIVGLGREGKRISLDAHTKHVINLRDEARCIFKDEKGTRCVERKWLHIHHKLPVCKGGDNDPENLVSLCSAHHGLVRQLSLPT
jgi:hypothetical protein